MATLLILELETLPVDGGELAPVASLPPVTSQAVTYTTSTASAAFNERTRYIRVQPVGADAYIESAAPDFEPTATTSSAIKLADGEWEYFSVRPGMKIAAYDGVS